MEAQPFRTLNARAERKVWKDSLLGVVLGPSLLRWVPPASPHAWVRASAIALALCLSSSLVGLPQIPFHCCLMPKPPSPSGLGTKGLLAPTSCLALALQPHLSPCFPGEAPSQWDSLPTTPIWALACSGHAPSRSGQGERAQTFPELALHPGPGRGPSTPTWAPPESPDL